MKKIKLFLIVLALKVVDCIIAYIDRKTLEVINDDDYLNDLSERSMALDDSFDFYTMKMNYWMSKKIDLVILHNRIVIDE